MYRVLLWFVFNVMVIFVIIKGAIWPSLSPCTVINPILLTYLLVIIICALYLPIFFRVASLALGWSCKCPSANEAALEYMCESDQYLINSLWPSDTIWRQRSGSKLAQVMACCLTAPSPYLNQCWFIISKVEWHSYYDNFTRYASTINHQNLFENYMYKI